MNHHFKSLDSTTARLVLQFTEPYFPWKRPTIVRLHFNAKGIAIPSIGAVLGRDPGEHSAMILDVRQRDLVIVYSKIRKGVGHCTFRFYRVTDDWDLALIEPDRGRLRTDGYDHLIEVTDLHQERQVDSCFETLRDFLAESHPEWLQEILERQVAHWRAHKHEQFLRLAPSRATAAEFAACFSKYPLLALANFKSRLSKRQIRSCVRRSLRGGVMYAFDELSTAQVVKAERECPGEMIRHAADRLPDAALRRCSKMAPYTAFECRLSMPPARQATVLSVAYPYYTLLYQGISETALAEEIIDSVTHHPEEWLHYHGHDFGTLFLALRHHLGLTIAPSRLLEMLHRMAEEHRPLLDRYLASRM